MLRKKHAANTSDSTRKNQNSMCGSCSFIGRKGNTPPQAPAAFTARNDAYPNDVAFGLKARSMFAAFTMILPKKTFDRQDSPCPV